MFGSSRSKKTIAKYDEPRKNKHNRNRDESSIGLIDASNNPSNVWISEEKCMITARRLSRLAYALSLIAGMLAVLEIMAVANIPAIVWLVIACFICLMNHIATGTWSGMISAESSKHEDTYTEYFSQLASNPLYIINAMSMFMFILNLVIIAFIVDYAQKDLSVVSHLSAGYGTPYIAIIFSWFLYYVVFQAIISLFALAAHVYIEAQRTITTRYVRN